MNILITGISSGIGNYLAKNLKTNNKVFGLSRTDPKLSGIKFFKCDLTNKSEINSFLKKINEEKIVFDAVILNAGVGFFDKFEKISDKNNLQMLMTNLYSPILLLSKLSKNLTVNSKIILMGSVSSKKFMKYGAVYQASKFGLRGLAGALKNEGKKAYLINPKLVKTNFHQNSGISIVEGNFQETKVETILETVKNILDGKENRFEIDL